MAVIDGIMLAEPKSTSCFHQQATVIILGRSADCLRCNAHDGISGSTCSDLKLLLQYLEEYRQSQATWHPMMQDLTAELQRRIGLRADQQAKLQGGSAASNKKQGTVPKPFQLSVSLPRAPKAPGTPKAR